MDSEEQRSMHVVMFPWLAMGHLLPFLRLSKLLARKGHTISFISTPRNISRLPKLPPDLSTRITFVPFILPPVPGLPPHAESSMDVPYNKQQRLKAAFDLLQVPVTEFLRRSSPSPDWVLYDYASHWLPAIAAEIGVSKAFFSLFNASALCFFGPPDNLIADSRTSPEDFAVVPSWVPFESSIAFRVHEIVKYVEKTEEDETGVSDSVRFGYSIGESDAVFVRSCTEFEPEWFGLLRDLCGKPVLPTGFLPPSTEEEADDEDEDTTWVGMKKWLDEQRVNSVVYVALGTEASLTREELTELALGLEKSALPFFWVLRNESTLPDGFEERVKGRGVVRFGWVPQTKILSHESVGGFVTHCGWNSVIEGLGLGRVPILFPVVNEQGLNARLLQGKRLGVEIPRDERDGAFDRDSVADSVRSAMVDETGESVRAKVKEMKGLFGDKDVNIRCVDGLVRYLDGERSSTRQ